MRESLARDAAFASRTPAQAAAAAVQEGVDRGDLELRSLLAHWRRAEGGRPLPAPYLLLSQPVHKAAVRLCRRDGGVGGPSFRTASGAAAVHQTAASALLRALELEGGALGASPSLLKARRREKRPGESPVLSSPRAAGACPVGPHAPGRSHLCRDPVLG